MGSTMGNFADKNVMDPNQAKWGDLDTGEKTARVTGGAARGLGQGMQAYQQQNSAMRQGGGMMPSSGIGDPQAPQFSTGNLPGGGAVMGNVGGTMPGMRRNNNMFYGF